MFGQKEEGFDDLPLGGKMLGKVAVLKFKVRVEVDKAAHLSIPGPDGFDGCFNCFVGSAVKRDGPFGYRVRNLGKVQGNGPLAGFFQLMQQLGS